MPIDRNLLTKAAKVYEAAEAVEGMKPKEVYESHKKCTPGEFGMHKEGGNKKADLYGAYMGGTNGATLGGLLGGGLGGVGGLAAGALSSRKGRRVGDTLRGGLKGLVGGGLLGAGAGAGLGASAAGQLPVRAIIDAAKRGNPLSADELRLRMSDGLNPATFAGLTTLGTLGGAAAGGALGGAANHALFDNKKEDNDTDKKKTEKKSADPRMPTPVDGPDHEYLRKSLGKNYYENRYAPDQSERMLRDAQFALRFPTDPASRAQEILNREQRYLADYQDDAAANRRDSAAAAHATGAARAVSPLFGRYGRMAGEALHGAVTGGKAITDLVSNPYGIQRQQHDVNQAQQALNAAKNPWERNPNAWRTENYMAPGRATAPASPAPFKPTGIPGFVDRIGQQIGNIKMPPARQMYKALHNSVARPFDDVPAMTKSNAAQVFGMRVKQSLEMPALSSLGNVGVGGLAGAGLGGLYGLMNPGEEEDEHGRMRRRSRFGAALRGALGGGVLGAGGGALATYLANRPKPAVAAGGAYEYDINNPSAVDRSSHAPMPHKVETLA